MKRTLKLRTVVIIIAFLMVSSLVTSAVFGEEEEPGTDTPVATVTFDYNGSSGLYYKPMHHYNSFLVYWNDGTPQYPGVTVTVNVGGETITLQEDVDYYLSFSACYDMDGDFSQGYVINKSDAIKEGFYTYNVSGKVGSPYYDAVRKASASTPWYVILNRPPYYVRFFKNTEDDTETYTSVGPVAYGGIVPADEVPDYDNPGFDNVGWYFADGTEFVLEDPLIYDYTQTGIQNVDVYAKWVKDESSGDDPTPGGDDPTPGGDDPTPGGDEPNPGGDGTDDTEGGGKPVPNTGVENMIPLFLWLLAASGLIIYSIRKKRA